MGSIDMKQVMMNRAKARAFGRTCQCRMCKHSECGNDIECIANVKGEVVYLCYCCGKVHEQAGYEVYEIVF